MFEGEPYTVPLDNGNDRFVVESTVKVVLWVLVKVKWGLRPEAPRQYGLRVLITLIKFARRKGLLV